MSTRWNTYDINDSAGVLEYSAFGFTSTLAGAKWYKAVMPDAREIPFYVASDVTKVIMLPQKSVILNSDDSPIAAGELFVIYP